MSSVILSKEQSGDIARAIYPDIKDYCSKHFERFFQFILNEYRKEMGLPQSKSVIKININFPFDYCVFRVDDGWKLDFTIKIVHERI